MNDQPHPATEPDHPAPTQADLAALDRALARDQAEHVLATAEEALL